MKNETLRHTPARTLVLCDETIDLIRREGAGLLPVYFGCALPFALSGLLFADTVIAGHPGMLPALSALLVATGFMRWLGGAVVQRRIVAGMGNEVPGWRAMLRPYFLLRFLHQPLLAGPIALDPLAAEGAWAARTKIVKANRSFFFKYNWLGMVFFTVFVLQMVILHVFLADLLLPYVFGLDSQIFKNVLYSRFWWMGLVILFFLAMEFFNLVAGVLVYQALSARWSGADLLARFNAAYPGGDAPSPERGGLR